MKPKSVDGRGIKEDKFGLDLSRIIENKHADMIRVANAELVTLFWRVGKELNKLRSKTRKTLVDAIAKHLSSIYGPFFSRENLRRMELFAIEFPDFQTVTELSPFISWGHIKSLLGITDLQTRDGYLWCTLEQGLTENELRKLIAIDSSKDQKNRTDGLLPDRKEIKVSRTNSKRLSQLGMKNIERNKQTLKDYFKGPLLSSFRALMETIPTPAVSIGENNHPLLGIEQELTLITEEINTFRRRHNQWLNCYFNLSLGEIGKRINHEILLSSQTASQKVIIHNASVLLKKKYGENFNEQQLQRMSKFSELFGDSLAAIEVASLVSWPYIIILSSLQDMAASLFYARLVAYKNLSVDDLGKEIFNTTYEQTKSGLNTALRGLMASATTVTRESVEKKKHTTIKATSFFVDQSNSSTVSDIFNNPYFPLY